MRQTIAIFLLALLAGCASIDFDYPRTESTAFSDTAETRLGGHLTDVVAGQPEGQSGIYPMADGIDALAMRLLLAERAERSIDTQYYLIKSDIVGNAFVRALLHAADRGVKVRLILDDLTTILKDETHPELRDGAAALVDAHPNIEIRLFNAWRARSLPGRVFEMLGRTERINHRMHNKLFVADNRAAVIGGRNIGNEYFGAGSGVGFADLDVIVLGSAVREVSTEFNLYWNSQSAYPAASFVGAPGPDAAADLEARFAATRADPESIAYLESVRTTPLMRQLLDRQLAFEWSAARLVYDDIQRSAVRVISVLPVRDDVARGLAVRKSWAVVYKRGH